ncbi:MAG TPA: M56 family metallopeptidase, partial [Blastocatellia bacterium]|nr:M56 family metallopeptidase [Blastocatellia bacterium]
MNALTNPFVAASAKGAAWLLVWSWQAAVLLACVWAGLKIFRVKSPSLRHQVWLLALIAVAAMPALSRVAQSLPLPQPNNRALTYAVELPRMVVTNDAAPVVQTSSPAASVKPSITKPIILSLSFAVWLWGVCAFAMKAAINSLRLRRLRAGARLASLADLDCDECDCEALRSGKAGLAVSDEIRSPILIGVLRPMIVFPADITSWTSPMERSAMLRHELAHVERRDHYVNLFQTVLGAVFFFHPPARYACRQLAMEREMACDDHVIGSGAEAESYAESIIKAAERGIGAPRGAHQLALFSARHILERRIEMILNKDRVRVIARQWKYMIPAAALIALIAWTLIPGRLTRPGLAQAQPGDTSEKLQIVMSLRDKKAYDSLLDMALGNPDAELRRLAAIQITEIEGFGGAKMMPLLYEKSDDQEVKAMVIDALSRNGKIGSLTEIALQDPSLERRRQALSRVKWLKESSDSAEVKAFDVSALQGQLNELSQEPPAPPPPPPPPPAPGYLNVEAGKPLAPLRWHDQNSVFGLLRAAVDASIRRDTDFFERVLDENYQETEPDGEIMNKAQAIADVRRTDYTIKKVEFDDLSVSGDENSSF